MGLLQALRNLFQTTPPTPPMPKRGDDPPYTIIDPAHVRVNEREYRVGHMVEGTMTLQTVCPVCEYGEGYNEAIIAGLYKLRVLKCETCGTEFFGPTMGLSKPKST